MKQENDIKDMLLQINAAENNSVEFDEAAIIAEYRHNQAEQSSLAIKILTILGGTLASSSFLGFFMGAGLHKSGAASIISGLVAIIASLWLNKAYGKLIIDTISISLYACGFLLIGIGSNQFNFDENLLPISFILIGICSLLFTQNFIISFTAIVVSFGSILELIHMHRIYPALHIYILILTVIMVYWMLNEAKIITMGRILSKLYNPARMGLIIAFIGGLCFLSVKDMFPVQVKYPWISSMITIAGILYMSYVLCIRLSINAMIDRVLIYVMSLLILGPTIMAPAISGSILIILLSFLVNYKTGFVIGILSLICFVSLYYYDLGYSLLTKSYIMMATGLLFLLIYMFTYKKLRSDEEV